MQYLRRFKRSISFLLAMIIFSASVFYIPSYADDGTIEIWPRQIIFANKNFTVFGKTHHMMSYYQEGVSPNAQPTFCLEPGKKLPDGSKATYRIYTATGDETIPGVGDSDKFVPITLAYEWMQRIANLRDPVCYAVVQTYIWG